MLRLKLQSFVHLMQRTDSLEKTLMLGKIEGGRRRGWQDEMVGWLHQLDGHESEKALGIGDGQGGLVCCSPWGRKESDTTEHLNWTDDKTTANIILNSKKLKAFPLRSETRQGCPLSPLWYNIVSDVLSRATRQEKEIKFIQIRKKELNPMICRWHDTVHIENPKDCIKKLLELINEISKVTG